MRHRRRHSQSRDQHRRGRRARLRAMILRPTVACAAFDSRRTARAAAQLLDDRTASEFLARMSQELRTPINTLLSFARALETSATGKQRPEDLRVLSRVRA